MTGFDYLLLIVLVVVSVRGGRLGGLSQVASYGTAAVGLGIGALIAPDAAALLADGPGPTLSLLTLSILLACLLASQSIGIAIGLSMALWPGGHLVYRPAHAHANLLGFLSMFLFGVAYHVLPRFVQKPLSERRQRWAMRHFWIQNLGLALMVAGWDGCDIQHPGFPQDGSWKVRAEGLRRLP